jgi:hypothetical protein
LSRPPGSAAHDGWAAGRRALAPRGSAASASEATSLLRGEPAESVGDADLCRRRLLRRDAAAQGRAEFFRGLRSELGGERLPYAWTSEWHPGGHGLHVHFTVGRYVRERLIRQVWGRGITHIKRIQDLPVGSGAVEEARRAAGYLAKYVSKGLDEDPAPGLHRYEVAQGFQPHVEVFAGESEVAVIAAASERMGGEPVQVWRSSTVEGWRAPPAYWCAWAG